MANSRSSQNPAPEAPIDYASTPADHRGMLIATLALALLSGFGLYQLITTTRPFIGGELWLFFFLLQLFVTNLAVPFVRYFNVRLTPIDVEVPSGGVVLRQSVWIGLYVVVCAWLQIPRALSLPLALFIALVFIVVEVFLRWRELANGGI